MTAVSSVMPPIHNRRNTEQLSKSYPSQIEPHVWMLACHSPHGIPLMKEFTPDFHNTMYSIHWEQSVKTAELRICRNCACSGCWFVRSHFNRLCHSFAPCPGNMPEVSGSESMTISTCFCRKVLKFINKDCHAHTRLPRRELCMRFCCDGMFGTRQV